MVAVKMIIRWLNVIFSLLLSLEDCNHSRFSKLCAKIIKDKLQLIDFIGSQTRLDVFKMLDHDYQRSFNLNNFGNWVPFNKSNSWSYRHGRIKQTIGI